MLSYVLDAWGKRVRADGDPAEQSLHTRPRLTCSHPEGGFSCVCMHGKVLRPTAARNLAQACSHRAQASAMGPEPSGTQHGLGECCTQPPRAAP